MLSGQRSQDRCRSLVNHVIGHNDNFVEPRAYASYSNRPYEFAVTYDAGDGNDIQLRCVPNPGGVCLILR